MDDLYQGTVEKLDRAVAQAGQYWAAKQDIPEVRGPRSVASRVRRITQLRAKAE